MDASMRRPRPSTDVPLAQRDPSDPTYRIVELAQRGRMIVEVAEADMAIAESVLGAFHETTWYFRQACAEARRAWERLRAEFGSRALESALAGPPLDVLTLDRAGRKPLSLVLIAGAAYHVERIPEALSARTVVRLTRLRGGHDGPYYVCRLQDGSTQCDCAEWTYQVADVPNAPPCKHIAAMAALGWL